MLKATQKPNLRAIPALARRGTTLAAAMLLALSLCSCAWLESKQRELALRPTPTRPTEVAELRPGDLKFTVPVATAEANTQQLALWWLPHADPNAPTLLYLHGTFRNLYRNLPKIDALRTAGFAIVAVDYRGWGDSTPIVPSEATIVADAWMAWAELMRRQPDARKRVIYGHSLGGSIAVNLASQLRHGSDYGALILESTFTRLPDVAAVAGFWGSIGAAVTTLEFDSLSRIGNVDAPVLMLHGADDNTVPVELGRRLRDAARPGVRWIEVPGGSHSRLHSQVPELYQQSLRDLMNGLTPTVPTPAPATATTR
jgi:pimeloyl-ACP methyl ester carboxylesterase